MIITRSYETPPPAAHTVRGRRNTEYEETGENYMKNIVLVGFMGTGKTVVAELLSEDMGNEYVSVDSCIVSREGSSISDIFKDKGESYFRTLEKDVIREISANTDQIIDTGGGVVLDSENMENLIMNGVIVCLWADPDTIYERTKDEGLRPLLDVPDPKRRIKELLDFRRSYYENADIHINTTDMDIRGVVDIIKKLVKETNSEEAN